jgi:hypothetical protein
MLFNHAEVDVRIGEPTHQPTCVLPAVQHIPAGDRQELTSRSFMNTEKERELREKLAGLRQQHRDLDAAISALELSSSPDQLQISRLKRQKLKLKDKMSAVEDQILPDIIA